METATTGGSETAVEQSQRSDGRHHHVPEAAGMEMAASHDLRHSKRTRGEAARNMLHGPQGVGGEQARWCKEWAYRRTEKLLPRPLLEPVILANKRAFRYPQEAPAIRAALHVMQSGWTQEAANKAGASDHPFCFEVRASGVGLSETSIVGMPSLS